MMPRRRRTINIKEEAELRFVEKATNRTNTHVDINKLEIGTYVSYYNIDGIWHTGLISEIIKGKKRVVVQLWAVIGSINNLIRQEKIPISSIIDILGHKEIPKKQPKKRLKGSKKTKIFEEDEKEKWICGSCYVHNGAFVMRSAGSPINCPFCGYRYVKASKLLGKNWRKAYAKMQRDVGPIERGS